MRRARSAQSARRIRPQLAGDRPAPTVAKHAALPSIYPDYNAPIIRNRSERLRARHGALGLPTPPQYLAGKRRSERDQHVRPADLVERRMPLSEEAAWDRA